MEIKGAQKPYYYSRQEDDRECPLQEVLGFFPQQPTHVGGYRHAVVGQFHYEGNSSAPEESLAEEECRQDASEHAQDVEAHGYQSHVVGEECQGKESIYGNLGRAGHEGCEQDGESAVSFAG